MHEHEKNTAPSTSRWSLFYLTHTVMAGLAAHQRIALLEAQDEHLANLARISDEVASVGYRLNAVAPAEPSNVDLRFPGMEEALAHLREASTRRWEQINDGGRLEDPALWRPATPEQVAAVPDELEAEAAQIRQLANRLTVLAVHLADAEAPQAPAD